MAYQTIRDLVAHVRSLHRRLGELVHQGQTDTDDERTALLLRVIEEHQSALDRAVEAAEMRSGQAVLDTWLQFEPNTEVDRAMRQAEPGSLSSDAIVAHVLKTESSLVKLYELLHGSTSSLSVQSFLSNLLAIQDSATRRSARLELEASDF